MAAPAGRRVVGHLERYALLCKEKWPEGGGPPRDPLSYLMVGGQRALIAADTNWAVSVWLLGPEPRCVAAAAAPPPWARGASEPFVEEEGCAEWGAREWTLPALAARQDEATVCVPVPAAEGAVEEYAVPATVGDYISTFDELSVQASARGCPPPYLRAWDFTRTDPAMRSRYAPPAWAPCSFSNLPPLLRPRFEWLFVGPAGCETRAHIDPLLTHAWLAQLEGGKDFLLLPPWEAARVAREEGSAGLRGLAPGGALEALALRATLRPGDVLLIPQGWLHYAVATSHSVTLTHNYLPAENWPLMRLAAQATQEARRALRDAAPGAA